jgi:hypothetical protein
MIALSFFVDVAPAGRADCGVRKASAAVLVRVEPERWKGPLSDYRSVDSRLDMSRRNSRLPGFRTQRVWAANKVARLEAHGDSA